MTEAPRLVVSAIIERAFDNTRKVFVQDRYKPIASPNYLNMLEIPAGNVQAFESPYDALSREVLEETGMHIVRILDDYHTATESNISGNSSMAFKPYLCQYVASTDGGLPWYGYVFRCEVEGENNPNSKEAKNGSRRCIV